MCCGNCEAKVRKEVLDVHGVTQVKVDRSASLVAVIGEADQSQVLKKLKKFDRQARTISVELHQASLDLIEAVRLGNAAKVSEVLAQPDVDVNCYEDTWHRRTPVLQAFQSKHMSVVRVLLADHRVKVNAADILGQTALHTQWDECVNEMLLSKRQDIDWNAPDKIGQTPLLFHARVGNDRIIRSLIRIKSVNMFARTIDGFTALHQVVERQSPFRVWFQEHDQISSRCNIVACLLEEIQRRYSYDSLVSFVNTTDILNRSVLHYIAEEGCVDILRELLGKCSSLMNVNSVDFHGFTPLHLAIQNGHTGVVELLLQLHNIDANVGAVNASHLDQPMIIQGINRTREALDEAELHMLKPNIGANVSPDIPDGGIEVNASTTGRPKPFEQHHIDMCRPNLLSKTPTELPSGNLTPLHLAAIEGQTDIVCLLMKWKWINVAALDTKGFSPLDYSIQKGHLEVVKLLLDKGEQRSGFSYNIQIGKFEKLLHFATKHKIAIHLLNTLGSRMETSTDTTTNFSCNQSRLLTSAAQNNHFKIIGYILKWQPEVNVNERSEWAAHVGLEATPVHFAALRGHGQVVRELLKHPNLDVNTQDNKKMTALLYAIEAGNVDVVKALCEDKLNRLRANEENSDERTPLQIVAEANNNPSMKAIEKVLLERPEVKDFVDRLYRDRQVFVDAANALLVGAALIASVTFAGWLQPPLGYTTYYDFSQPFPAPPSTYESYAAVKHRSSVKAFWVFNSLSFFFAIATVLAGADAAMPNLKDAFIGRVVKSVRRALIRASILLVISVVCVLGAFASAGIAVLPPLLKYDTSMIITVCLGGTVCMLNLAKIIWKLSTPVHMALLSSLRSNEQPMLRSVQNGEPLEDLGE
jgi:ankyrin repeat protein